MKISLQIILSIISIFLTITAVLFSLLLYVRSRSKLVRRERYDFENNMVELEYMRKNMELQLYDVSRKLEENDKRWKDMNHLVISSQNKFENSTYQSGQVVPNNFLKNFGITDPKDYEVDSWLIFVLTPFNDNYRDSFKVVRNICEKLNLRCIRGDEDFIPNEIFPTIIKQILKARLIVANITGRNPNVMYELGVAHALGKTTIIIAKDFTDIPFDLNSKRIILYNTEKDLETKFEQSITEMFVSKAL